ncbi:MAG: PepSY domain-containing protein [Candidatus Buchananbacteria bacterium]|nr:PepSY domain-containing protein [Candidatus Buchananbacteria bacterium]
MILKPKSIALVVAVVVILIVGGVYVWQKFNNSIKVSHPAVVVGDKYILDKVGSNYNKLFEYQEGYCGLNPNSNQKECTLIYDFKGVDEDFDIQFSITENYEVTTQANYIKIPNCLSYPEKCTIIPKSKAIKIAQENKFEGDEKLWTVNFDWDAHYNTDAYVWQIFVTTGPGPCGKNGQNVGKVMIISAYSGKVLGIENTGGACY